MQTIISGVGRLSIGLALVLAFCGGCASQRACGTPGTPLQRCGDEIVVCGQLFHTGAPVVLWTDPGGYDAYRVTCRFTPERDAPSKPVSDSLARYSPIRRHLPEELEQRVLANGWTLEDLQQQVDQFVLHYDVCGTSRRCFEVLQDIRGLSVHFMLDVDGTIYQTLDLKERAWHAGSANDRSVGVEIANIGAYGKPDTLQKWYARDWLGRTRVTFPPTMTELGIRTPGFVARPRRSGPVFGELNGRELEQYDFTPEQYRSLVKLTATLCKVLPKIKPDYPRDENGNLRRGVLTDEEMANFGGVLGHLHITKNKVDPGPALDWDYLIENVRAYMD